MDKHSRKRGLLLLVLLAASVVTLANYVNREQILQFAERKYGKSGKVRIENWYVLIDKLQTAAAMKQIKQVNRFFNRIRWLPDEEHWHQRDYWATPLELLGTDGGDCEDFSIAKYFSLLELGMPEDKLRITYVIATRLNQAHMVLAYYDTPAGDPVILDSPRNTIAHASARSDLHPVYSFNGKSLWLAKERNSALPPNGNKLTTWQDVNRRILQENGVN